jgi:Uma2 family endonuclease
MAMGEAAKQSWSSYTAYLEIERESGRRHEWLDGQVYAMAGGSLSHSALAVAVAAELRSLSRTCGCQVFSSDAKVRVLATGLATYPDVSVVCGPIERDSDDHNAIMNPSVLVEVLSTSTEGYDRGAKFAHFRELPSPVTMCSFHSTSAAWRSTLATLTDYGYSAKRARAGKYPCLP